MPEHKYKFPDRRAATRLIIATDGEGKNYRPDGFAHPDDAVQANGWHSYTLLAAASDERAPDGRIRGKWVDGPLCSREPGPDRARNLGLSTADCLEFLLSLPADALVTSFYFSYDVVKILADLPLDNLREIASGHRQEDYRERVLDISRRFNLPIEVVRTAGTSGIIAPESTVWGNYWIQYMPRKKLTITDLAAGRSWVNQFGKRRPKWNRQIIVWDVFGFFQKAFVKALKDAPGICPPDIVKRIVDMKDQRGDFANLSDDKIREYCLEECEYLVKLVRDMLTHIERLGLKLNGYDGSGALARAWMKAAKIPDYKSETNLPFDIQLSAYFGGRFEVSELGYIGKTYSYDINSAYPAIIKSLPCLKHGTFRQLVPDANGHVEYEPGKFGVYLTGSKTEGRFAPFPFRIDDVKRLSKPGLIAPKSVYYAHGGKRWIWQDEIRIARKHFGKDAIPLYDGWVWESECDHKPFDQSRLDTNGRQLFSVQFLYDERKVLKAAHDGAEKVLKLLINSIYGKTAQSIGGEFGPDGIWKPPAYQSFIWAGLITSGTRAMILDAVMQSDTVSIATDGILSRTPLAKVHGAPEDILPVSNRLGDWEADEVTETYLFQSGVYTMLASKCDKHRDIECPANCENRRVYKTRGFSGKEIPAQKLIDTWNRIRALSDPEPEDFMIESESEATRFVPMKAGILRTNPLDYIGQWVKSTHKITIAHSRRMADVIFDAYGLPTESIGITYSSMPYTFADTDMSSPYILKDSWEDMEADREEMEGDFYEIRPENKDS